MREMMLKVSDSSAWIAFVYEEPGISISSNGIVGR